MVWCVSSLFPLFFSGSIIIQVLPYYEPSLSLSFDLSYSRMTGGKERKGVTITLESNNGQKQIERQQE